MKGEDSPGAAAKSYNSFSPPKIGTDGPNARIREREGMREAEGGKRNRR